MFLIFFFKSLKSKRQKKPVSEKKMHILTMKGCLSEAKISFSEKT